MIKNLIPYLDSLNKKYKFIIQAGGKGTRVPELTGGVVPKSLCRVVGPPLISRQLRVIQNLGFKDILLIFNENWQAQILKESIRIGEMPKLNYNFHIHKWEEDLFKIFLDQEIIDYIDDKNIILSYGDLVYNSDLLQLMLDKHDQNKTSIGCRVLISKADIIAGKEYYRYKEDKNGKVVSCIKSKNPNFIISAPLLLENSAIKIINSLKTQRIVPLIMKLINLKMLSVVGPALLVNLNNSNDLEVVKNIIKMDQDD